MAEPVSQARCPSEDAIGAYVEGDLAAKERARVDVHVAQCDDCRLLVAELMRALMPADEEEDTFSTLRPALRIARFVVTEVLGEGGMGVVYAAKDPVLRRKVAVKLLRPDLESVWGENAAERLLREAQATARLSHPNVVTIYDAGTHDGRVFIAMELVDGITAKQWIQSEEHDWRDVIEMFCAVGRGLGAVHDAGFVHRDFKPDNILIGKDGRPRVSDFGFVRFGRPPEEDDESSVRFEGGTLTIPGQVLGTPAYMAPEQIVGDEATAASDQFSFCVALWEALFKTRPYRGKTMAELRKAILAGDMVRPSPRSIIPSTVVDVLVRGLSTLPENRYSSMGELLVDLQSGFTQIPRRTEEPNPYPGLVPFSEEDSERFFGRDHEITQALSRLHDNAFMAIVGPSGTGKSSLIRAGIIPSLTNSGQNWEIFRMRPGRKPVGELARLLLPLTTGPMDPGAQAKDTDEMAALLRSRPMVFGSTLRRRARHYGVSILVFIDQLEELYTLASVDDKQAFVSCITQLDDGSHSPIRVICSIRGDLIDRVGEDRELLDRLSRGMMFLGPPDSVGLRAALVGPLGIIGHRFEDEQLADDIVRELEGSTAALPLLQFAATRLWQARNVDTRTVTRASYEAMGTVTGALAQHAEQIVAGLSEDQHKTLRAIMTKLVTPERSGNVVSVEELWALGESKDAVELLIEVLVDASLLVKRRGDEGPTIELTHEALIEEWPSLRQWLNRSARDEVLLDDVRRAAARWSDGGRPRAQLWGPETAEDAQKLLGSEQVELDPRSRDFLTQIVKRAGRTGRARGPLISILLGLLIVLLAAFASALVWIQSARDSAETRAREEAQRADQAESGAKALESRIELLETRMKERPAAPEVGGAQDGKDGPAGKAKDGPAGKAKDGPASKAKDGPAGTAKDGLTESPPGADPGTLDEGKEERKSRRRRRRRPKPDEIEPKEEEVTIDEPSETGSDER